MASKNEINLKFSYVLCILFPITSRYVRYEYGVRARQIFLSDLNYLTQFERETLKCSPSTVHVNVPKGAIAKQISNAEENYVTKEDRFIKNKFVDNSNLCLATVIIWRSLTTMHQEEEEKFQSFETKIDEVMNILKLMNSSDKSEQKLGMHNADRFLGNDKDYQTKLNMDDFIVRVKENRTVINKVSEEDEPMEGASMGKMAFMAELERDAARRAKERKEREEVAQNLRKLGNQAFHLKQYEKAINMYTKAIDQIKDSHILYNNRALAYIRLGLYKRAIIDSDFVLQKLDEKNLRAWLYRANGYYLLGETSDFEKSINEAKKSNPKELQYIENAVNAICNNENVAGSAGGLDDMSVEN